MMKIAIRPAAMADAPLLRWIEEDAAQIFRLATGLEWLADESGTQVEAFHPLIEAGTVWLADGEAVCGFLAARRESSSLHVVELSVRRECQRQGIGRRLISAAADHARGLGLGSLTLTTFRDLPWNEPLYASLGFRTQPDRQLSDLLRTQLDREASAGLPRHRRCAMKLTL